MAALSGAVNSISPSTCQQIYKLCSEFLGPSWSNPEHIKIQPLSEGRCNRIYCCQNAAKDSANKVIIRLYGSAFLDGTEGVKQTREKEVLVSYVASERQLGPRVIGIFDGGRIEEFIQSNIPTREQFEGPSMFEILAHKTAFIHSLRLPFSRQVRLDCQLTSMVTNLASQENLASYFNGSKTNDFCDKLLSFNYALEVDWLVPMFRTIPSKIVFCHQDLNRSNILIRQSSVPSSPSSSSATFKDTENKIILIDYEFAGYSYRWSDIATFFSEIAATRWKERKTFDKADYPAPGRRSFFVAHYLKELVRLRALDEANMESEKAKLMREIDFGGMVLNLVNALWRLSHPKIASESMLFLWEEANFRLDLYLTLKEYFINNY